MYVRAYNGTVSGWHSSPMTQRAGRICAGCIPGSPYLPPIISTRTPGHRARRPEVAFPTSGRAGQSGVENEVAQLPWVSFSSNDPHS
ncbi:hypothetical protein [Arthrobacter ramosus]|uniref:hypothetical protein n=1 Tax=Arthrobacter ramosus TaxID=1672 RepID=UPI00355623D3